MGKLDLPWDRLKVVIFCCMVVHRLSLHLRITFNLTCITLLIYVTALAWTLLKECDNDGLSTHGHWEHNSLIWTCQVLNQTMRTNRSYCSICWQVKICDSVWSMLSNPLITDDYCILVWVPPEYTHFIKLYFYPHMK